MGMPYQLSVHDPDNVKGVLASLRSGHFSTFSVPWLSFFLQVNFIVIVAWCVVLTIKKAKTGGHAKY
jgi:ABC-type protease/lipase transport system fused ATPase/permease subunit